MKTTNIIGAVVASLAFIVVIFAATFGQLFSMSGTSRSLPSYGTKAVPTGSDIGATDTLTYDETGKLVDFGAIPGEFGEITEGDNACPDKSYIVALRSMKVWKKGSVFDAVKANLQQQIDPLLGACAPPAGADFACAPGCTANGEDKVNISTPLTMKLTSANAVGPGMLQYVFSLDASCLRVRQCDPQ